MRRPVCSVRWDPEWLSSGSPGGLGGRGSLLEAVTAGEGTGDGVGGGNGIGVRDGVGLGSKMLLGLEMVAELGSTRGRVWE